MTKSFNVIAAAALFSSVALGGAFAAAGDGTYYNGADRNAVVEYGNAGMGAGVPAAAPEAGDGDYYQGANREGAIDTMSTGSITNGVVAPAPEAGDRTYYEGVDPAL